MKPHRFKLIILHFCLMIGIFLFPLIPYYLTSIFFRFVGNEPSELVKYMINHVVGFALFMILISTIVFLTRSKRNHYLQPLIDAMRRIGKGEFNIDLTSKRHFRGSILRNFAKNLDKMAEELNEREQMRQEFISNVSHEIQSPLTSISGFARVLRNDELSSKERHHYLDIIETESRRLSKLSENMLKLTSLQAYKSNMDKKEFRLDHQLKNVVLLYEPLWQRKGLELDLNVEKVTIKANEELLSQVWINLLHNAIKFTPEGGTISIELHQNSHDIVVIFKDTGIGISEKDQEHIFERFYKSDLSRNRTKGGSGLGLAIVKKIIELHEGTISVDSKLGTGTTFTIQLSRY
jgi:two-component system, OmpR family, phosphate regulon sensor histidine kinase PhoR